MCFISAEITPKEVLLQVYKVQKTMLLGFALLKADKLAAEAQNSYLNHIIKIYPSILYLPLFMLLLLESTDHIVGSLH